MLAHLARSREAARVSPNCFIYTFLLLVVPAQAAEDWHYLDNGQVRLGVNLNAGACIGWFSKSGSQDNLLNAYDVGRYVQQSYYGDEDGSDWNGKPWRYNPVQGGSWKNAPAEVMATKSDAMSFYAKTKPRHWATGAFTPECVMEEWLRLDGGLARLKFKMTWTGDKEHKARHQELPALFVTPKLDTLVFADANQKLVRKQPGFPNEYIKVGEPWCAWVDANDHGLGLFMPHTTQATCYRVRHGNKGDCSYVAPIQTFALKPGLVFEYEVVLTIGSLEEIRAVFAKLK
ncbi:hypothetical protein [Prosthecobacter sp.]|uniref:hypothetical protein n=1 Tax=Prosthecobacter sp. TaxID=1965333 RepID=UPI001E18C801|nr:hypothetical protein [Prosthecobacter sp.]MCB1275675.1 hypothetical protein [Prosthecobacter sp.]